MKEESEITKQSLLKKMLDKGMVLIALDARTSGVIVPKNLAHDYQLKLNLSHRFGLPMLLSETGIEAILTFSGKPHECVIPWKAIFLIVSHNTEESLIFPEDFPTELIQNPDLLKVQSSSQVINPAEKTNNVKKTKKTTPIKTTKSDSTEPQKAKPRLSLIRNPEATSDTTATHHANKSNKTPSKRTHLRLVK
jgi:stringent starvation protein B